MSRKFYASLFANRTKLGISADRKLEFANYFHCPIKLNYAIKEESILNPLQKLACL